MTTLIDRVREVDLQTLADVVSGEFIPAARRSNLGLFSDSVTLTVSGFTIQLDYLEEISQDVGAKNGTISYTRIAVPYLSADNLRWKIEHRSDFARLPVLSWIGKTFASQSVFTGDAEFDRVFNISEERNNSKAADIFADSNVRELILLQPYRFSMSAGPKARVEKDSIAANFRIQLLEEGVIEDLSRLRGLFEVFSGVLKQMLRVGSAEVDTRGQLANMRH